MILGASDEYANAKVPGRTLYTDHSLMGNYYTEGAAAAEIKAPFRLPRHRGQPVLPGSGDLDHPVSFESDLNGGSVIEGSASTTSWSPTWWRTSSAARRRSGSARTAVTSCTRRGPRAARS